MSPRSAGWTRRRSGRGFTYLDASGERLGAADVERIKALVIPPAWEQVWICPLPQGHIQAVGTDAAGRRQYLYHPQWRAHRDRDKFDRVTEAARRLPAARRRVEVDLALPQMPLERVAAAAIRLLDLGYFRIGSDAYAQDNGSFGLTTLERAHVQLSAGLVVFEFVGKSGVTHTIEIDDEPVIDAVRALMRRRAGSDRLLAYRDGRRWVDLDAAAVNTYLDDLIDGGMTAKDFRTWHATVIAAVALATTEEPGQSVASRKRAVSAAAKEVAGYLGNTPTIARNSYIDPRVIDHYQSGTVIDVDPNRFRSAARRQAAVEKAVLKLLED